MSKQNKPAYNNYSMKKAYASLCLAFGFFAIVTQQVWTGKLRLHGSTKVTELKTYVGKLEFLAKYLSLQAIWLVFTLVKNARARVNAGAQNPLIGKYNIYNH